VVPTRARRRSLVPPTGKRMEITGITIERFADGKVVEEWTNFDALGLMQQLGLVQNSSKLEVSYLAGWGS
jgi:hypothetical protein